MRRFRGKHISAGRDFDAGRAPETAGFRVVRQSNHIVMSNGQRILTIPRHNPVNAITMGVLFVTLASLLSSSGSCYEASNNALRVTLPTVAPMSLAVSRMALNASDPSTLRLLYPNTSMQ